MNRQIDGWKDRLINKYSDTSSTSDSCISPSIRPTTNRFSSVTTLKVIVTNQISNHVSMGGRAVIPGGVPTNPALIKNNSLESTQYICYYICV